MMKSLLFSFVKHTTPFFKQRVERKRAVYFVLTVALLITVCSGCSRSTGSATPTRPVLQNQTVYFDSLIPLNERNLDQLEEISVLAAGASNDVYPMDISSNNQFLVGINQNLEVLLWDLPALKLAYQIASPTQGTDFSEENRILFSPDQKKFATGLLDGVVYIWNVLDGQLLFILDAKAGPINAIAFSSDGAFLAASYEKDRSVRIWDIAGAKQIKVFYADPASARTLAFKPQTHLLVGGSRIGGINAWDLDSGRSFYYSKDVSSSDLGINQNYINLFFANSDGALVSIQLNQKIVNFWEKFPSDAPQRKVYVESIDNKVLLTADAHLILTFQNQQAQIRSAQDGKMLRTISVSQTPAGLISSAALSPDNRLLVMLTTDGDIHIWGVLK